MGIGEAVPCSTHPVIEASPSMTHTRWLLLAPLAAALTAGRADAQVVSPGGAYGRYGPGYYGMRGYPVRSAGTVTDYQSLINAITSLPGWYGPAAPPTPHAHPHATMPRAALLSEDGKVLWPSAAPDDPARRSADAAVRVVVQETRKYGHASTRQVINARNKLTAFAGKALPALKTRNAADAEGLERFIVELQKTLATMAVNY